MCYFEAIEGWSMRPKLVTKVANLDLAFLHRFSPVAVLSSTCIVFLS